jgi:hypothetical protein
MKIAAYRFPEFQKKIDAFNKKATKWGLPLLRYVELGREMKTCQQQVGQDENGLPMIQTFDIEMIEMEVHGDTPKIGGWMIHSKVEPTETPGVNLVYTQKNFEPVEKLRTTGMVCEHCNHNRYRSLVYLLQNVETGEQKLVGKSCLKDFLPDVGITNLLAYLGNIPSLEEDDGEDYEQAPATAWLYSTQMAIAEALVLIRRDGFVSKKMINELIEKGDARGYDLQPTSASIGNTTSKRHLFYTDAEIAEQFEGDAESRVSKVIEFINAKDSHNNDFIYNLQTVLNQMGAPFKMFAFIAAGVQMWIKSTEDTAKKEAKSNEYLGEVGSRVDFNEVTVVYVTPIDGQWGTTYATGFEDAQGNSLVWFGSKRIGDAGKVLNIKATIKKHDMYKERKQTVLTRVAVI